VEGESRVDAAIATDVRTWGNRDGNAQRGRDLLTAAIALDAL